MEATKRPWHTHHDKESREARYWLHGPAGENAPGNYIGAVGAGGTGLAAHNRADANAALIVKAVNCHDELLAACRAAFAAVFDMLELHFDPRTLDAARWFKTLDRLHTAILKAEGEAENVTPRRGKETP